MGFCTCMVKVIAAVILFVAFVIGIHAHVESKFKEDMDKPEFVKTCENIMTAKEGNGTANATLKAANERLNGLKDGDLPPVCPSAAIPMEQTFVAFTGILFVASVVMIILGQCVGQLAIKCCDSFYCILAGILIFIAGVLMIVAAYLIDNYMRKGMSVEKWDNGIEEFNKLNLVKRITVADMRKEYLFWNKIVAGCLAIIDAIIYKIAACIICYCST